MKAATLRNVTDYEIVRLLQTGGATQSGPLSHPVYATCLEMSVADWLWEDLRSDGHQSPVQVEEGAIKSNTLSLFADQSDLLIDN